MSWKLSLGGTLIVSTMVRYTTLATCFPNPSGLPLRKEIRTRGIDGPPGWRRVASEHSVRTSRTVARIARARPSSLAPDRAPRYGLSPCFIRPLASAPGLSGTQLVLHRQPADALAGRGEDRIRDGGHDGRRARFADPPRGLRARDQMDVDRRRLVDPQHTVVVEVVLFHAAVLECDLAPQRRADPEDDPALDLRLDGVRVHDRPAVDRRHHALDPHDAGLRDADLGDLGDVAPKGVQQGYATRAPGRQRATPSGLLGGELEHRASARRLVEERPPLGDRILRGRRRGRVHEAFDHEDVVRGPEPAPERRRNGGWV